MPDEPSVYFSVAPMLDLAVEDEISALTALVESLRQLPAVGNFPEFLNAILERQKINPPILGEGVALPHARTTAIREIVCAAARCKNPVAFGPNAVDTQFVFLFGVPPHRICEYLAMTAALVRRLKRPGAISTLLAAQTPEAFADFFH